MSDYVPNQLIEDIFLEVDSTTGLSTSSFTKAVYKNGSVSGVSLTIVEVGNGLYELNFTPDSVGTWFVDLYLPAKPNIRYQQSYKVQAQEAVSSDIATLLSQVSTLNTKVDNLPSASQISDNVLRTAVSSKITAGNVADYLNRIKKYTTNKVVVTGNIYSVKEDDKTTEFESGNVDQTSREPS